MSVILTLSINDENNRTILSISSIDKELKGAIGKAKNKIDKSTIIGNTNPSMLFYLIVFLRNFVDSIIVFPILITAGTLLYFDIRSDKENYDINKLTNDINISTETSQIQKEQTINN